jgi:exopolysaccharide production protein ExoZ
MQSTKFSGLQVLRGLAAWGVVFHHINQTYYDWNPPLRIFRVFNYGSFGVDLFFVLSGFIMFFSVQRGNTNGPRFFLDRVFRIFPVYWSMTVLLLTSSTLLPKASYYTFYNAESLLKSFLLIPCENPNGLGNYPFLYVGWSLTYEMFFYLALSASLLLNKKKALLLSVVIISSLPIALGSHSPFGHSNNLLYEFAIGIAIAFAYSSRATNKVIAAICKPVFSIPLIASCVAMTLFVGFTFIARLVVAAFVLIVFLLNEDTIKNIRIIKPLVYLGDISYSTYLVHPIVLGWFQLIFLSSSATVMRYAIIASIIATVLVVSMLSYKHIETSVYIARIKDKLKSLAPNGSRGGITQAANPDTREMADRRGQ